MEIKLSKRKVHFTITSLPPELFIAFCSFLPPADLFTLSQVCRKFRGYLCAPNSFSTQQIWKESRLRFMPNEDMPPPEGMNEEKYVALLMTERGCQICKHKVCKIYWEFEVRCCHYCFSKETLIFSYPDYLLAYPHLHPYPQEFLCVMPYYRFYRFYERCYWKEQIEAAYSQYSGLSNESLQSWLDGKRHVFDSIMKYATQREQRKRSEQKFPRFSFFLPPILDILRVPPIRLLPLSPLSPPSPPSRLSRPSLFSTFESRVAQKTASSLYSISSKSFNDNNNEVKDVTQLIQFHIKRLENYEQGNTNIGNSNELNRNDFIKKRSKKDFYDKYNEFHTERKNLKSKFSHKYR